MVKYLKKIYSRLRCDVNVSEKSELLLIDKMGMKTSL